ncbi:MAG TPA: DUF5652 family protein [Candidatus Nanoarchaeia archaeon]|nr:DUF5652 family protein [Candidatus Nanoarchaeia archaeon]
MAYDMSSIANQLGISIWLMIPILFWSLAWKLAALWKSARKSSIIWFVVLGVVNTMGILEILYIFIFSEWDSKPMPKKSAKKKSRKK